MCAAVSAGERFLKEQASSSARTVHYHQSYQLPSHLLQGIAAEKRRRIPRKRSIAHCSNCSSVISAVGGVT